MPALARGSKVAGLVHGVVAYVGLPLLCESVTARFDKGDDILNLLESLVNGEVIFSLFILISELEIVLYMAKR